MNIKTNVARLCALTILATGFTAATTTQADAAASAAMWNKVAKCESGGNWRINTGNGYYGGLQINLRTWKAYGGNKYASHPHKASKAQQILVANKILKSQGRNAWGGCARKAGLR